MKHKHLFFLLLSLLLGGLIGKNPSIQSAITAQTLPTIAFNTPQFTYTLDDYFGSELILEFAVNNWYERLNSQERIGQIIMPALEKNNLNQVKNWIKQDISNLLILKPNITKTEIDSLQALSKDTLWIASDAEPSLMQYRFPTENFKYSKTSDITSIGSARASSLEIAEHLNELGIHVNFAPIYDTNTNQTIIGDRALSDNPNTINQLNRVWFKVHGGQNIITTAKHFPDHGLAEGDTHFTLQGVSGETSQEIPTFKSAIRDNIPLIMVGHLTVENQNYSSKGLPATLAPEIMQNWLREDLGYQGIIITDALNMGALNGFKNSDLNALIAGADIALVPADTDQLILDVKKLVESDPQFAQAFEEKVKRVLRMKLVQRLSTFQIYAQ